MFSLHLEMESKEASPQKKHHVMEPIVSRGPDIGNG